MAGSSYDSLWRHSIAFALQANGDWYSTIFCKFVANIFQNGTPVLRTIVLICNTNALREVLGMRDGTHVFVYPLMKREIWLTTFVWIELLGLFLTYHLVSYTLDIWLFICLNLLLFIVITCVFICLFTLTHMWFLSMCFIVLHLLINYVRIRIYIGVRT